MTPDLVSIIVPVHNRPTILVEAVESALAQTYRPIEILIVDDGSTDETPDSANRLAVRHPELVRVLRRPNGGPGCARETGRLSARGEFLQYLDSDDLLRPEKLSLQVGALREQPDAEICYGMCVETLDDGSVIKTTLRPSSLPVKRMFPLFLAGRWWNTVVPLYRASLTDRVGAWSELRLEEDWEYDGRAAALDPLLAFVPHIVAEHRGHAGTRASRGASSDPARLEDQARAHVSLLESAQRGGVGVESPEMAQFSRELFLLSRQCGAAGLALRSRELFHAARRAATRVRSRALDFRLYRFLAGAVGWGLAGRLAMTLDALRPRPGGAA